MRGFEVIKKDDPIPNKLTFKDAWAKTDRLTDDLCTSVLAHNILTGFVLKHLITSHKLYAKLQHLPFMGATHDVGKVNLAFLLKSRRWIELHNLHALVKNNPAWTNDKPHSVYSQKAIFEFIKKENPTIAVEVINNFTAPIGAHHGRWNSLLMSNDHEWATNERKALIAEIIKTFPIPEVQDLNQVEQRLAAGFISIADWAASSCTSCGWDISNEDANDLAIKLIKHIGLYNTPIKSNWRNSFSFSSLQPCQELATTYIKDTCIAILEDQTGNGKTEAALMATQQLWNDNHARGLYFGLPTTITSEQIYIRIQTWLKTIPDATKIKLCHSKAWLNEKSFTLINGATINQQWFNSTRKSLLVPIGVGTVDQAVLATTGSIHSSVRLSALAGKVVILDEIHSYDTYTNTLICKLISELEQVGCTVIILSATLTHRQKEELLGQKFPLNNSFPLLTVKNKEGIKTYPGKESSRARTIKLQKMPSATKALDVGIAKAQSGKCVLIITNTVKQAQEWYKYCKSKTHKEVGLLHSRFTVADRNKIEDTWLKKLGKKGTRPKGCILIGTQVLEQSLDIDADFLISNLCPMDFLIQRLGRLWRHAENIRSGQPSAIIVMPSHIPFSEGSEIAKSAFGKSRFVYEPFLLWKTLRYLNTIHELVIPQQTRGALEEVYGQTSESGIIADWKKACLDKRLKLKLAAESASMVQDRPEIDDQIISTRYENQPTISAVLCQSISSKAVKLLSGETIKNWEDPKSPNIAAARAFNLNSVPINLKDAEPDPALNNYFINGGTFLCVDPLTGEITNSSNKIKMNYSKNKGLELFK